jgi:hypothetical protein
LDFFQITHFTRNIRVRNKNIVGIIINLFKTTWYCLKISNKTKPDLYLGVAHSSLALISFIKHKPCIVIDDTEHTKINHFVYKLFCSTILTPFYFDKCLGKKQLYFQAYLEQFYLHSKYFHPDIQVLSTLGLNDTPYVLIRYISYDAIHDMKVHPLSENTKKEIVNIISKKYRVIISEESNDMDDYYKQFYVKIKPETMHDLIANAVILITEGATMASEAGILGCPYLYINPLRVTNVKEQIKCNPEIAFQCSDDKKVIKQIQNILNNISCVQTNTMREKIEETTINPTDFIVWFVENYPNSIKKVKETSDFQFRFK